MLSFWLQGCQSTKIPSSGMQVKVTRVLSGQTLEVEATAGAMRVRLVGIDAPSLQQQPWGEAALQRLEAAIATKTVLLEFDTQHKDTFGRNLAYVWHDGVLLNEQLVKEGYVLW
ncbi:MAG TPA: nuclease, partial [Cyanobacteria bacterium UBA11049]|nr:nuclease [Cyanobacteria bacterium UBA11049]